MLLFKKITTHNRERMQQNIQTKCKNQYEFYIPIDVADIFFSTLLSVLELVAETFNC